MDNTSKKITTNCGYIYITDEKISIEYLTDIEFQINLKKFSKSLINLTNENLDFTVSYLNLEICKWIHEILQTHRITIKLNFYREYDFHIELLQYLFDNATLYNTTKLSVKLYENHTEKSFNLFDQIFKYAIIYFNIQEIQFYCKGHRNLIYNKNTIELDD